MIANTYFGFGIAGHNNASGSGLEEDVMTRTQNNGGGQSHY